MKANEVIEKYCNTCIHKAKCYKPCPVVLMAIGFGD